jgi:hypothetical protein
MLFLTLSLGLRDLRLPVGSYYRDQQITHNTPGVKRHVWKAYTDTFHGRDITYDGIGLLLEDPRTWVDYDRDIFYINHRTIFGSSEMRYLSEAANALSPRDAGRIQHLAVDVEVFMQYEIAVPFGLVLSAMLHRLRWLPNLKTLTLVVSFFPSIIYVPRPATN